MWGGAFCFYSAGAQGLLLGGEFGGEDVDGVGGVGWDGDEFFRALVEEERDFAEDGVGLGRGRGWGVEGVEGEWFGGWWG